MEMTFPKVTQSLKKKDSIYGIRQNGHKDSAGSYYLTACWSGTDRLGNKTMGFCLNQGSQYKSVEGTKEAMQKIVDKMGQDDRYPIEVYEIEVWGY